LLQLYFSAIIQKQSLKEKKKERAATAAVAPKEEKKGPKPYGKVIDSTAVTQKD
jgi:hypothetical protein